MLTKQPGQPNAQVDGCAMVEESLPSLILGSFLVSVYLLTQPTSSTSRSLSGCLDSLSPYHLNSHHNSLSIIGTGGCMPSCIGSMVVTMSWGSRNVSRREQGESSCRVVVDPSC